jgi:mRNA interferase RelE/StbE
VIRTVKISKRAEKYLKAHPDRREGILERLQKVSEDPNRRDLDIKPFEVKSIFRLRVGSVRVIYEVAASEILVALIDDRGDVYKKSRRR